MPARYNANVNGIRPDKPVWGGTRLLSCALPFCIAAMFSAAAGASPTHQLPPNAGQTHGWILADLDGDRIADLAAAGPGSRDGAGYVHTVQIDLSGFPATSFMVRGTSKSIALAFRDVNGDEDRDLIVFEPWSSLPLGIWLNDGAGHFKEANVADYLAKIGKPGPRSFHLRQAQPENPAGVQNERTPMEYPEAGAAIRTDTLNESSLLPVPFPAIIPRGGFAPRGPPSR